MVMGEVSLCRVEELPPTFARELRPALAIGDPALLSVWVRHESFTSAFGLDGETFSGAPLLARGPWPPVATHQKAVIGALANRFHNVANLEMPCIRGVLGGRSTADGRWAALRARR